jgi:hypothetical protein
MEVRAMATPSLVQRARQSHSRKSLTPEEIIKALRVASESKGNLAMILLQAMAEHACLLNGETFF